MNRRASKHRPWLERRPKNALDGYRRAPRAVKAALALGRFRAPPLRCARCLAMIDASQLEAHLQRCPGSVAERDADVMRRRGP